MDRTRTAAHPQSHTHPYSRGARPHRIALAPGPGCVPATQRINIWNEKLPTPGKPIRPPIRACYRDGNRCARGVARRRRRAGFQGAGICWPSRRGVGRARRAGDPTAGPQGRWAPTGREERPGRAMEQIPKGRPGSAVGAGSSRPSSSTRRATVCGPQVGCSVPPRSAPLRPHSVWVGSAVPLAASSSLLGLATAPWGPQQDTHPKGPTQHELPQGVGRGHRDRHWAPRRDTGP